MKALTLSSYGLRNITLNRFEKEDDFALIFGEHEFRMNSIFAEFISPVISHLHQSDPTIQSIKFDSLFLANTNNFSKFSADLISDDIISLLLEISSGFSIEINSTQAFKLRFLSIILGNEELYLRINDLFQPDFSDDNINTYMEYMQLCYHFSQFSPDFDFSGLVDNVSSNFYSIDKEKFLNLPLSIQNSIISNPLLKIKSEDSLLDIVLQIIEKVDSSEKVEEEFESVSLLEHIEFTGLSEDKLREFLSTFDFNRITNSLWKKFYQCFFIHFDQKPERIEARYSNKLCFDYIENKTDRFKGIIHYLTEKCGGNVDEKNVCKLTASSIFKEKRSNTNSFMIYNSINDANNTKIYSPSNAVDLNDRSRNYSSVCEKNSWLKFDFIDRKIRPSHYSIRTWSNPKGGAHLQNWVIEGSNSNKENEWIILDSRNNETSLDNSYAENTFSINTNFKPGEFYRYLRIRQTGPNSRGTSQLVINEIEFFGEII